MVTLVVGASGYVGRNLCQLLSKTHEVYGTYFRNPVKITGKSVFLDIRDKQGVSAFFQEIKPDLIYHLAYDREDLDASIVDGTRNLLEASAQWCPTSPFIFMSTDAVFDGEAGPFKETDEPKPIWDYGKAKRRAELEVLSSGSTVIRTSLVYGFDPLDPRTEELKQGLETGYFKYKYFEDEIRCPTFVDDLCGALIEIGERDNCTGDIFHVAGPEAINRYEFAEKLAFILGFEKPSIPHGYLSDSGFIRPKNLTLDISLTRETLKTKIRTIEEVGELINSRLK